MTNCKECKEILKPHNDSLCNACTLKMIKENRPIWLKDLLL